MAEPAVGGSAGTTMPEVSPRTITPGLPVSAQQIEDAMTEAVLQCAREEITDDPTILARKLAARSAITGS